MFGGDFVLINVHEEISTKKLRNQLGKMYQTKYLLNHIFLSKKLYSLRMKEGGQITNHLKEFNILVAQFEFIGVKMDREEKCQILLCSLSDLWDYLVMAICSTSIILKTKDVVGVFLSEEMHRKINIGSKESLVVHGRPKEKGKKNEKHDKSKSRGRSKSPRKSKVICWNCGKLGHIHKECKEQKKKKINKYNFDFKSEKKDGDAFIANFATHIGNDAWLIESSASFRTTYNRDCFSEYK